MSTTHPQPLPLIRAAWSQESQDLVATEGLSFSQESAALKEHFDFFIFYFFFKQRLVRYRAKVSKFFLPSFIYSFILLLEFTFGINNQSRAKTINQLVDL